MPTEDDDATHDQIATTTQAAATTSLPPQLEASNTAIPTELPSDHPHRPTKPSKTGSGDGATATGTDAPSASSTGEASTWLPSFLPTFGASPHTLAWIYGAIGLIVLFVCGLGVWWWIVRRNRMRNNPRDNYEFELLNEEEGEGLNGGGTREKGQNRRGGELYDAFAGGSEDEDEDAYEDGSDDRRRSLGSDEDDDAEESVAARRERPSSGLLGRDR